MDIYSFLRTFADSYFLIAMVLFYVGVVLMLFRPGAKKSHQNAAHIPFRNGDLNLKGQDSDAIE